MLTIKIEEDYAGSLTELGIEAGKDAVVMTVKDNDVLMGAGVMYLKEDYGIIDTIFIKEEFGDFSLEYGLGKSMLNVVDLRGIRYAVSDNLNLEKLLKALRFKSSGEADDFPEDIKSHKMCLNLDGYFLVKC